MEDWEALLTKHGFTLDDVNNAFNWIVERLEKKTHITEKRVLSDRKVNTPIRRFATKISSEFPLKMFVLQEMGDDFYRLGYYIISLKKLKEKGELLVVWGQYNPSFLKKDFDELWKKMEMKWHWAKPNGIPMSKHSWKLSSRPLNLSDRSLWPTVPDTNPMAILKKQ